MQDSRRWIGQARLHPYLGSILADGARLLRQDFPECKIKNAEFAHEGIRELESRALVFRVEARIKVPSHLRPDLIAMAKHDGGSPIWIPSDELGDVGSNIWMRIRPIWYGGEIVWPD